MNEAIKTRFSLKNDMSERISCKKVFTLIEVVMAVSILGILFALFLPMLQEAKANAKFTRWFAFNKICSRDPDCVINFNFQEGKGNVLENSADGCDAEGFVKDWYTGILMNTDGTFNHHLEWVSGGRWGKFKKALQFNGINTCVLVPGSGEQSYTGGIPHDTRTTPTSKSVNFSPADDFTILCWVRLDNFRLGDGIFAKSAWGSSSDASAQYDLYCDPTAGSTGQGSFEVDVFTSCVGWDETDVALDKIGWCHIALRYKGAPPPTQGDISCFVNGQQLGPPRPTNNSTATGSMTVSNLILGAIGAISSYWGSPIIFPFQGRMDEFLLYKKAMSDGEIRGHYEMGRE